MTERLSPEARVAAHFARAAAQVDREQALAAQMRADLSREADRQAAELKVREGVSVNLADLAIPPTPEWERQGEAVNYTVKTEGQNVQVVTTRRRVITPVAVRLCRDGKITDDQYLACRWYRIVWEQAGLLGRYKTSSISLSSGTSGGGGMGQHPMARHENEAVARLQFRLVRGKINRRFLPVFDFVVLEDCSLRVAAGRAKSDNSRLLPRFRDAAQAVSDFIYSEKIDLGGMVELKEGA